MYCRSSVNNTTLQELNRRKKTFKKFFVTKNNFYLVHELPAVWFL